MEIEKRNTLGCKIIVRDGQLPGSFERTRVLDGEDVGARIDDARGTPRRRVLA